MAAFSLFAFAIAASRCGGTKSGLSSLNRFFCRWLNFEKGFVVLKGRLASSRLTFLFSFTRLVCCRFRLGFDLVEEFCCTVSHDVFAKIETGDKPEVIDRLEATQPQLTRRLTRVLEG